MWMEKVRKKIVECLLVLKKQTISTETIMSSIKKERMAQTQTAEKIPTNINKGTEEDGGDGAGGQKCKTSNQIHKTNLVSGKK